MRRKLLIGWAALIFTSILMFPQLWSGQATWYTDDLVNLNIPQRVLLGGLYHAGKFSLWNPYSFAGQPLLAAMQSGPLYLPNLVFVFLPLIAALNFIFLFHWLLGTCGMYAYLIRLNCRSISAYVGAIIFGTCGFWLTHVIHTQMINSVAWIPVLFALTEAYFATKKHRYAIALSIVFALQFLAGHPQITYYTGLLLVPYFLVVGLRRYWVWGSFACAFLVSCAQLLPTLELIKLSIRNDVTYAFFSSGAMSTDWWATLVFPFLRGGGYSGYPIHANGPFWEFAGYCGFIALLVAVGSLFSYRWNRRTFYWVCVGLIGVLFAMGDKTPLLEAGFHYIPGFSWFRIPARFVLFVDLSVAVLAGMGLESLAKSRSSLLITSLVGAFTLFLTYRWCQLDWQPEGIPLQSVQKAFPVPILWAACTLAAIVIAGSFSRMVRSKYTPSWVAGILVLSVLGENLLYGVTVNQYALKPAETVQTRDPVIDYFRDPEAPYPEPSPQTDAYRVISFANVLALNHAARYGIETINGYDSLITQTYNDYLDAMWSWGPLYRSKSHLDLLNTRYAVVNAKDVLFPTTNTPSAVDGSQWRLSPSLPSYAQTGVTGITVYYRDSIQPNDYQNLFQTSAMPYTMGHVSVIASPTLTSPSAGRSLTAVGEDLLLSGRSNQQCHLQLEPSSTIRQIWVRNDLWSGSLTVDHIRFFLQNGTHYDLPVNHRMFVLPWTKVFATNKVTVYQNPTSYPRVWASVTGDWQVPLEGSQVSILSRDVDRTTVDVRMPSNGTLALSQLYYPGWYAKVDGEKAIGVEEAGLLTSIPLTLGHHVVSFYFDPPSWKLGVWLSMLGLLAWVLWGVFSVIRKVW